ncbi:MAG: TonB-dependent receptor [Lacunisphaera sp.]|nr:TonB-dependent receptor [Lacunisphaera sp.]
MHTHSTRRVSRGFLAMIAALLVAAVAFASEPTLKKFDVPADKAPAAIKVFSQQAGVEVLVPTDAVAGIKTNAAQGEMTPRAALEKMVAGTGFVVVPDEQRGALGLRREPGQGKNADSRQESIPAAVIENGAIKLETYKVLGSRIRQTDTEGPSPVNTYNREYIEATGAMTLSDFLSRIPQVYSGIASGRSSAPDEFNPDFGQRTETTSAPFNLVLGASDAPIAQSGVSGVSLRGLGAGSTLVLVDGRRVAKSGNGNRGSDTRQGFVDLNTISLGMIDHIEVSTDGASAIYGADAVAGVINIILKKDYRGTELSGGYKASEHGGGEEGTMSVTSGFVHGKLSGTLSLDYFERQNLSADQRAYSKNQDHTAIPRGILLTDGSTLNGRNYTLNWGYPAVIQASGGTVSGNFDAIPGIRVVLVPVGSTGTPTLAQFIPVTTPAGTATVVNATGQRRANTAAFLDLAGRSQRRGANGTLRYRISDRLEANASYRTSDSRSLIRSQPVTSVTGGFGSAVALPAAFNPFNQNVTVGMILPDWGSTTQRVRTLDDAVNAGLRGNVNSWEWDLSYSWQDQSVRQTTRNFNGAGFANLLINPDPAQRFNPFVDFYAPGAVSQAALLETLSVYPELYSKSKYVSLDFDANGDLFTIKDRTVKLAFGGSSSESNIWSRATSYSNALVPVVTQTAVIGEAKGKALFAEFYVPVFDKQNNVPLFQRLDFQLAARYEDLDRGFTKTVPKYGVSWSPVKSVLVRGSWSQGFRAPSTNEYVVVAANQTLTLSDPRRTPPSTPGVVVTRGSSPSVQAETSENAYVGLVYEPTFVKGLSLEVNYYDSKQANVLQIISAQNMINNEALFPERITRLAPTAADIVLNQPGQITGVDQTFINFGRLSSRSVDFAADYTLPWENFGRFRLNVSASHNLESVRQVVPGQPEVVLEEDTGSPPKWTINSSLFWNKGAWTASAFLWYLDGFKTNNAGNALVQNSATVAYYPTPAVSKLDVRVGYGFKNGLWRGYGKGLRVNVGVNNVFDKQPAFSDTLWGFNAGLHKALILGRAYEFSFNVPL